VGPQKAISYQFFSRGVSIMKSRAKRVRIAVLLLTLLSALASATAWGWTFDVTANANFSDSQNPCKLDNNGSCSISSYINDGFGQPLTWNDPILAQAFGNWTNSNAAYQGWSIAQGGTLPGTLDVSEFYTFDEDYNGTNVARLKGSLNGGVEITANYQTNAVNDPFAGKQWFWAQAITLNYRPGKDTGHLAPPDPTITTMDEATFNKLAGPGIAAPPLYPYQYWPGLSDGANNGEYFDAPNSPDHLGYTIFFHAEDFLVTANTNTDVLTVYQGFNYGWDFTCIPEPSSFALLGLGSFSLLAYEWRRRKAKA
jgi:hypothetical protein